MDGSGDKSFFDLNFCDVRRCMDGSEEREVKRD
jgi:hypothetical protein